MFPRRPESVGHRNPAKLATARCNFRTLAHVSTRLFPIASAKPTPLAFPALNRGALCSRNLHGLHEILTDRFLQMTRRLTSIFLLLKIPHVNLKRLNEQ
jgi:hypothetical protein